VPVADISFLSRSKGEGNCGNVADQLVYEYSYERLLLAHVMQRHAIVVAVVDVAQCESRNQRL
jgi:hypothetical protein